MLRPESPSGRLRALNLTEAPEASVFDLTCSGHSIGDCEGERCHREADRGFLRLFNLQALREDPC